MSTFSSYVPSVLLLASLPATCIGTAIIDVASSWKMFVLCHPPPPPPCIGCCGVPCDGVWGTVYMSPVFASFSMVGKSVQTAAVPTSLPEVVAFCRALRVGRSFFCLCFSIFPPCRSAVIIAHGPEWESRVGYPIAFCKPRPHWCLG